MCVLPVHAALSPTVMVPLPSLVTLPAPVMLLFSSQLLALLSTREPAFFTAASPRCSATDAVSCDPPSMSKVPVNSLLLPASTTSLSVSSTLPLSLMALYSTPAALLNASVPAATMSPVPRPSVEFSNAVAPSAIVVFAVIVLFSPVTVSVPPFRLSAPLPVKVPFASPPSAIVRLPPWIFSKESTAAVSLPTVWL